MKLIRLISNTDDGVFDNYFTEDIEVTQNSKISFENIITNIEFDTLEITTQNRTVFYKIGTNGLKQLNLKLNTYTNTTFINFVRNFYNVMNGSLSFSLKELGTTWDLYLQGGYLYISHIVPKVLRNQGLTYTTNLIDSDGDADSVISTTARGVSNTDTSYGGQSATILAVADSLANAFNSRYIKMMMNLANGSGFFRAKINTLGNDSANVGFRLFVSKNPNTPINIPEAEILCSVWVKNRSNTDVSGQSPIQYTETNLLGQTTTTNIKINGVDPVFTYTGDDSDDNSFIEVHISQNNIIIGKRGDFVGGVYNNNFTEWYSKTIFERNDSIVNDYYYVGIMFYDNDTLCRVSDIQTSLYNKNDYKNLDFSDTIYNLGVKGIQRTVPEKTVDYNLQLDPLLFKFLGFNNIVVGKTAGFVNNLVLFSNGTSFTAVSDQEILYGSTTQAYIIECINLNLDSYDGLVNKRKSILYVIPSKKITDSQLVHSSEYPKFIGIKNRNKLNMRNFKLRLLDSDLSPVKTFGLNSITLFIKDNTE